MQIRQPAFSGQFYPSDAQTLSAHIDRFLDKVELPTEFEEKFPRVLVVPHAGYPYSAPVAAHAYNVIKGNTFDRIVLIGNSHQAQFEQIAVDGNDIWKTPLGKVKVDQNFVENIKDQSSDIVFNSQVHAREHSLEVQLPFLQKVLNDFEIVPILLGTEKESVIEELARALSKNTDSRTLIVISTDLSHYPSYEDAKSADQKTIEAILSGDPKKLAQTTNNLMTQNIPNLATCACGEAAVRVGMQVAGEIGADQIQLLKYANSGDTAGDKARVVGYAAIGFFESAISKENSRPRETSEVKSAETSEVEELAGTLNSKQQQTLLNLARRTLETFVKTGKVPNTEITDPSLQEKLGAFVTLKKPKEVQSLRGCMGVFEPDEPLWKVIQDRTVAAASKDPRFRPVQPQELDDIKIEISVLSKPKKVESIEEIELEKHGVMVKRGRRGGTFLPQVAKDTGWDKETFLGQLCAQKAGLAWNCWKDPQTELYTYTAQIFHE